MQYLTLKLGQKATGSLATGRISPNEVKDYLEGYFNILKEALKMFKKNLKQFDKTFAYFSYFKEVSRVNIKAAAELFSGDTKVAVNGFLFRSY